MTNHRSAQRAALSPWLGVGIALSIGCLPAAQAWSSMDQWPWKDQRWAHRCTIEVDPAQLPESETLYAFPMLVSLDADANPQLFDTARADGGDILFTDLDGLVLDRELVSFDPIGRSAEIWVRVPALSRSSNSILLYYANPDSSLGARYGQTFKSNYRAVYHFEEDPGLGELRDSSAFQAHAQLAPERGWTSADRVAGQIHRGWNFNGSTHHIASQSISTTDSSFVVSAWVKNTVARSSFVLQANPNFWQVSSQVNGLHPQPDFGSHLGHVSFQPRPLPFDGEFHHFAWVFDGVDDELHFYFDGVRMPIHVIFPPTLDPLYGGVLMNAGNAEPVGILGPMYFNQENLMQGGGDEFRVHQGLLSAAWIATEVRNQRDPRQFLQFGGTQTVVPVRRVSFSDWKALFGRQD